ncbi:MAG TPA: hypothetical protein VKA87_09950 [Nitrososphaeraceae archaeon]|nr:hypothetical protein [Nitrososphaeraceae archaeon]
MNLKQVAIQLCTCTWIEIMTGAGITLYLLYLQSYQLADLTVLVFVLLIGFHFTIDRLSSNQMQRSGGLVRIKMWSVKRPDDQFSLEKGQKKS